LFATLRDLTPGPEELDSMDETATAVTAADTAEVVEELLVEEISIDGMCGVY